ncbi:MAG: 2-methylcitrate dehydratase [Bordetella sp. SCN 67-23]|mgnify:CR=1 FL=1|nr:MmgE/PrpD family protein [Burkholderiales bacterium]ODS72026.1 MAG: 2-methylcitrate dehydratase [Bordetella sp. SCN 67-23]ODU86189.1 MAG: 2-methylcitrate dehydratase [Bordetella sp. SCN 68-11]OJW88309.1 MAG: 2-methylcitrate dehydratase [Burkholderiales bacterium 67-32]
MDKTSLARDGATGALCEFVAALRFEDLPPALVDRTEDLFLDWVASALAGKGGHPVPLFERYAAAMGPAQGRCAILTNRRTTSAHFAALVNGAASHLVEQDDLHNSSVLHPATVVFPAVFAAAQDLGKSGSEMLVAAVAGYEAGVRIGEFLGRSHYRIFHTTGTVGTLAAAAGVARLLGQDARTLAHTLGSAGTQASGLWEFLREAADSKQLHTGQAAANGLLAAYLAQDGLTGAHGVLEGRQGMAAGMSSDADPSRLGDRLGQRWATLETSFKFHASCRHTHPAADALLHLMRTEGITHGDIAAIRARVHRAAIDVLGNVDEPSTVHQAKFSMGAVLGLIAVHGRAGLEEFRDHALSDSAVAGIRRRTTMVLDDEVDRAYPARWLGRVEVDTRDGRRLAAAIDSPKGDPDNTLSRPELETKLRRLAAFSGAATPAQIDAWIPRLWNLRHARDLSDFMPEES